MLSILPYQRTCLPMCLRSAGSLRSLVCVLLQTLGFFCFAKQTCRLPGRALLRKTPWSSPRPISIGQLNVLPRLHLRPINHVVYMGSYPFGGISHLRASFTLRCFQRLSAPHLATQLCHWCDNWCTRGASIPVLSY